MEMTRNYSKRETEKSDWSGEVGVTTLVIDGNKWTLDGKELPEASVKHLMNFALQTLQDAYAGAKSLAEAKGAFEKKRDAIYEGTIGVRGSGEGVSEFVRIARRLVLGNFKSQIGSAWKTDPRWIAFDVLDDDAKEAKLDAAYAKNVATFEPLVEAEVKRLADERKRKAAMLSQNIVIDL